MKSESNSADLPPTFSDLLDYAEGRFEKADHQRVAGFIAQHPEKVAADWAWVQDFLRQTRPLQLHAVPPDLEDTLVNLYRKTRSEAPLEKVGSWMASVRRVVAELVDPGSTPDFAAAGLRIRSFETHAPQWVFKTAHFDICVNALMRPDQRYDLHGQVFPRAEDFKVTAGSAQLVLEDREFSLATVNEFGEFLIHSVPKGAYALVIACEETEIVCNQITFDA